MVAADLSAMGVTSTHLVKCSMVTMYCLMCWVLCCAVTSICYDLQWYSAVSHTSQIRRKGPNQTGCENMTWLWCWPRPVNPYNIFCIGWDQLPPSLAWHSTFAMAGWAQQKSPSVNTHVASYPPCCKPLVIDLAWWNFRSDAPKQQSILRIIKCLELSQHVLRNVSRFRL